MPAAFRFPPVVDAHHRFLIAAALCLIAFFGLAGHPLALRLVGSWDAFATGVVLLAWSVLLTNDPYEVRRMAGRQDSSATFLFTTVITAATISLFAVFILLGSTKDLPPRLLAAHVALSVGAVMLSWLLIHTLFALRYAHLFYIDAHRARRDKVAGGLLFPGGEAPDYFDFAYFSFVVGMTCQVSDVQISSRVMRRMATVHGLISFVFNTAILAIVINLIAGLV